MMNEDDCWLIYFEDRDIPLELHFGEEAARSAFERRLMNWACHLFKRVA